VPDAGKLENQKALFMLHKLSSLRLPGLLAITRENDIAPDKYLLDSN